MEKPPRLLVIAGSDSGGGAGIQADIKTACAFGVYAMTAVTAVTAQDTTGVHAIELMPASLVREQIRCCLADIGADAIKIGMLGSGEIAAAVADALEEDARDIPLVLDPVLVSTSGTALLDAPGVELLKSRLIPLAMLVTPNIPELAVLTGMPVSTEIEIGVAARLLQERTYGVLAKGGHGAGDFVNDYLVWNGTSDTFLSPRHQSRHAHGTGCTLAAGIACGLAHGRPLNMAVKIAIDFVQKAIATAPDFGHGHGPLNHSMPK